MVALVEDHEGQANLLARNHGSGGCEPTGAAAAFGSGLKARADEIGLAGAGGSRLAAQTSKKPTLMDTRLPMESKETLPREGFGLEKGQEGVIESRANELVGTRST